jgi:hypothetical protein
MIGLSVLSVLVGFALWVVLVAACGWIAGFKHRGSAVS